MAEEKKISIDPQELESDYRLLKEISDIAACTGYELPISQLIAEKLTPICDRIETDTLGNLYATIQGTSDFHIVLDAHMDEIGFQVSYIEQSGFLRIVKVGGQNIRILPGTKVIVHASSGEKYQGVIGEKPIHLIKPEERKKTSDIEQLYVDIGMADRETVEKYIDIGDFLTFDQQTMRFRHSNLVTGKAYDDRAGCWVLIRALQHIKKAGPIAPTVTAVFSAQEEIGVRGATVAGNFTKPDMALVFEVNHAMDFPGASKVQKGDVVIGKGPIIPLGPNVYPKISRKLLKLAKEKEIPVQPQALPGQASNNARVYQVAGTGIPLGLITVPLRYMHTAIEVLDLQDLHLTSDLTNAFLDNVKNLSDL